MITIRIKNAEEVVKIHKGGFLAGLGKVIGMDLQRKIEEKIVEELRRTLENKGIVAEIVIKND